MRPFKLALTLSLCAASLAQAQAPDQSLRPTLRGSDPVSLTASGAITAPEREVERRGVFASLRPLFRPRAVEREASAKRKALRQGAVCGDVALQGEVVGRVTSRNPQCGVEDAVRIRSVAGLSLSQQSVMDCPTAAALKSWVEGSVKPTFSRRGGGVQGLRVAAHYVCKTRNSQPGAKISEHGKGRAIDISGFILRDGSEISVRKGWNAASTRQAMRKVHSDACGPFGTVLGPNSNSFHRGHFHLDTARYRSGPYCR